MYIYIISTFFLITVFAIFIICDIMDVKDFIPSIATLLAAFLGAFFAFKLNSDRELKREQLNNKSALNFALFTLTRQRNAILLFKKYIQDYSSSNIELSFNMPAYQNADYDDLKYNFQDLGFILESNNPNILFELSIEQERFEQAMAAIKIRNNFYVNEYQPMLSKKELNDRKVNLETLKKGLGDDIYTACLQGAEEMKNHVNACSVSIPKMHEKLFQFAKTIFPNEKFVEWNDKV